MRSLTVLVALLVALCSPTPPLGAQADRDLTGLARQVRPSVVRIEVNAAFGKPVATGTGFFVTSDGHLVTNHHVVRGATRLDVRTDDGRRLPVGSVVAVDEAADLALLEIPGGPFPALELGSSTTLEPGARVVVMGNPLGLDATFTEGIVSAIRAAGSSRGSPKVRHLQVTAPITFGSSGSPVLDMNARVVGVATSIIAGADNVGFAAPVERVLTLMAGSENDRRPVQLRSKLLRNVAISLAVFLAIAAAFRFLLRD